MTITYYKRCESCGEVYRAYGMDRSSVTINVNPGTIDCSSFTFQLCPSCTKQLLDEFVPKGEPCGECEKNSRFATNDDELRAQWESELFEDCEDCEVKTDDTDMG